MPLNKTLAKFLTGLLFSLALLAHADENLAAQVRQYFEVGDRLMPTRVLLVNVPAEELKRFAADGAYLLDIHGPRNEVLISCTDKEALETHLADSALPIAPIAFQRQGLWHAYITKGKAVEVQDGLPNLEYFTEWAYGEADYGPKPLYLGKDRAVLQRHHADCSVAATAMLLQRRGYDISVEDLYKDLDPDPEGDLISLAEMQEALKTYGISSQGYRGNFELLEERNEPGILHLSRKHFVVYITSAGEDVYYIDPLLGRLVGKKDDFKKDWEGVVYYVEKNR